MTAVLAGITFTAVLLLLVGIICGCAWIGFILDERYNPSDLVVGGFIGGFVGFAIAGGVLVGLTTAGIIT